MIGDTCNWLHILRLWLTFLGCVKLILSVNFSDSSNKSCKYSWLFYWKINLSFGYTRYLQPPYFRYFCIKCQFVFETNYFWISDLKSPCKATSLLRPYQKKKTIQDLFRKKSFVLSRYIFVLKLSPKTGFFKVLFIDEE